MTKARSLVSGMVAIQATDLRNCVKAEVDVVELVECCFTSTETVGLLGTGGRRPGLPFLINLSFCGCHQHFNNNSSSGGDSTRLSHSCRGIGNDHYMSASVQNQAVLLYSSQRKPWEPHVNNKTNKQRNKINLHGYDIHSFSTQ